MKSICNPSRLNFAIMYSSIGHYKHPGKFGSHLGVVSALPKYHSFIGMPRPLQARGTGDVSVPFKPVDFYEPNQGIPASAVDAGKSLRPAPVRADPGLYQRRSYDPSRLG